VNLPITVHPSTRRTRVSGSDVNSTFNPAVFAALATIAE
jgi:hypothetical protein